MKKKKIRWKQYLPIYLLALPGIIYMICNNYLPMFGIVIAFKKLNFAKGILASPWCGLKNFEFLFKSSTAFTMIRNTICYNVLWLILGHVLAIASAILLNEITNRFRARFYQSVILLPYLMSWVVVSYLVFAFLSADTGMFNNSILKPLGIAPVNWYSESKYWPFILTFVNHWKNNGYTMIVYFASIVGISQDYYEAAMLDGATKWQQIKHITIPQLVPTIITLMILSVGRIFASDFGLFYQIPRNTGALYNATQTIDVYVYNALMQRSDYGMASAASVFQSIVGFLMVMVTNAIVRKVSRENAMF
ncbi:MAG: sugar ABC transporter permease [Clostridiales bacterium 44_9]|nr:MAG: sugar ABC transporter permease [Clostridiales bacterium 44_9]